MAIPKPRKKPEGRVGGIPNHKLPVTSRSTSFDKALFIRVLRETKCPVQAAAATGFSVATAKKMRQKFPIFSRKWKEAEAEAADMLESSMLHRAIHGWKEPVFHQGMVCGSVKKWSTSLQIFMIKNLKPDKYSDFKVDKETASEVAQAIHRAMEQMDATSE